MTQVVTTGWPDRLLTLGDWESLPADELHDVECSEGVLIVTPKPLPRHQRALVRLAHDLDEQLPEHLSTVADVEVLLSPAPLTVRAPDVLVAADAGIGHYWIIDLDGPVSMAHHRLDAKGAHQHVHTYRGHMEVVFGGVTVRVDLDALSSP